MHDSGGTPIEHFPFAVYAKIADFFMSLACPAIKTDRDELPLNDVHNLFLEFVRKVNSLEKLIESCSHGTPLQPENSCLSLQECTPHRGSGSLAHQ